jgi:hypothetical protein
VLEPFTSVGNRSGDRGGEEMRIDFTYSPRDKMDRVSVSRDVLEQCALLLSQKDKEIADLKSEILRIRALADVKKMGEVWKKRTIIDNFMGPKK